MLKNINPILGPELLKVLREMGHGDRIAVVDANYPAASGTERLIRLDGLNSSDVLNAVVSVLPLDSYVDVAVNTMQVVGDVNATPEIVLEFKKIIGSYDDKVKLEGLERYQFYDEVKKAYAVVSTGEQRLYGNILLQKGVIESV